MVTKMRKNGLARVGFIISLMIGTPSAALELHVTNTGKGRTFSYEECLPLVPISRLTAPASLTLRDAICVANRSGEETVIVLPDSSNFIFDEVDNWWYLYCAVWSSRALSGGGSSPKAL